MYAGIRTIWDAGVVIDLGAGRCVLLHDMCSLCLLVALGMAYSIYGKVSGHRKSARHAPCRSFPALPRKAVVAEEAKVVVVVLKLCEQTEAAPVYSSRVAQTWRAEQLEKPAR